MDQVEEKTLHMAVFPSPSVHRRAKRAAAMLDLTLRDYALLCLIRETERIEQAELKDPHKKV